jgi:hypothetical protein
VKAVVATLVLLAGSFAGVDRTAESAAGDRFRPVAVYVDAGNAPLAAYQVDITVGDAEPAAKIVGVEGGDVDVFRAAPYYDPAALQGGRIVIAAFTTDVDPPRGRIRVATLHFFEPAGCMPAYRARLVVAVAADGAAIHDIDASVTLAWGEPTA